MKILLTGATGMVGRNVSEAAIFKKHELLTPSHKELDLLNPSAVSDLLSQETPDMIIHAAGIVGGIQANIKSPVTFLADNAQMGISLIMAAKKASVKCLLNLGSSCMYPKNIETPIKESMLLSGPLEPTNEGYALAKILTAKLCAYVSETNRDLLYKTVIPCNLYGRHDNFNENASHLIPSVINKLHLAKIRGTQTVSIWGNGLAKREFMYASDFANFLGHAVDDFANLPQYMNVGLGKDYTIDQYYETIASVVGFQGNFSHDLTRPAGMKRKLVDITQQRSFGWTHSTTLITGLKHSYAFFLERNDY